MSARFFLSKCIVRLSVSAKNEYGVVGSAAMANSSWIVIYIQDQNKIGRRFIFTFYGQLAVRAALRLL